MSDSSLGLKRDHSSSVLAKASNEYRKRNKIATLDTNEFDVEEYSMDLLTKCNKSTKEFANCLLQYFNNDRNKLHQFAINKCKAFNEMNKEFFNTYRFDIFKSLATI